MDSEALVAELQQYITTQSCQAKKMEETSWGSYGLAICFNPPHGYYNREERFGWGFTPEEAAARILARHALAEPMDIHFLNCLGVDRLRAVQEIVRRHTYAPEVTDDTTRGSTGSTEAPVSGSGPS